LYTLRFDNFSLNEKDDNHTREQLEIRIYNTSTLIQPAQPSTLGQTERWTLHSCCLCFRSSSSLFSLKGLLQFPRARLTISQWSFAVAGPSLWNSHPAALCIPETMLQSWSYNWKVIHSTSDKLMNISYMHHHLALLLHFYDSGAYKNSRLTLFGRMHIPVADSRVW